MGKHKTIGGIKFTASRGMSFSKKPSELNYCVGREMKGKEYPDRPTAQKAFIEALDTCGANLSPETKEKFGIKKTPVKKAPAKK